MTSKLLFQASFDATCRCTTTSWSCIKTLVIMKNVSSACTALLPLPLLSGPEQHMNSPEQTETPDLLFFYERKRMWWMSLACSHSRSLKHKANVQTNTLSNGWGQKKLTADIQPTRISIHIASSGTIDRPICICICICHWENLWHWCRVNKVTVTPY